MAGRLENLVPSTFGQCFVFRAEAATRDTSISFLIEFIRRMSLAFLVFIFFIPHRMPRCADYLVSLGHQFLRRGSTDSPF
jgi:hypothetical protein